MATDPHAPIGARRAVPGKAKRTCSVCRIEARYPTGCAGGSSNSTSWQTSSGSLAHSGFVVRPWKSNRHVPFGREGHTRAIQLCGSSPRGLENPVPGELTFDPVDTSVLRCPPMTWQYVRRSDGKIAVALDNNVWYFLFSRNIDLASEL